MQTEHPKSKVEQEDAQSKITYPHLNVSYETGVSSRSYGWRRLSGFIPTEFGYVEASSTYNPSNDTLKELTMLKIIKDGRYYERVIRHRSCKSTKELVNLANSFAKEVFDA